jgi:hypothetical protein
LQLLVFFHVSFCDRPATRGCLRDYSQVGVARRVGLGIRLRRYLGLEGFLCLAACASVGVPSWELTVRCVQDLVVPENRASITASLARPPWFRYSRMPEWLRDRIAHGQPEGHQARNRSLLESFVAQVAKAQQTGVSIVRRRFADLWACARARMRTTSALLNDYILLRVLWPSEPPRGLSPDLSWWQRLRLRYGLTARRVVFASGAAGLAAAAVMFSLIGRQTRSALAERTGFLPPVQSTTQGGGGGTNINPFLHRVLDVAARQVGLSSRAPNTFWQPPFVSWCCSESPQPNGGCQVYQCPKL